MARIFKNGRLNRYATLVDKYLPGQYASAHGVQYGEGATNTTPVDTIEFGEFVEIVQSNREGTFVKRATGTVTKDKLAIVLRDLTSQRTIEAGYPETVLDAYFTVVKHDTPNTWEIAVPVLGTDAPVLGGIVYVGLGTGGTTAGAVYAGSAGTGKLATDLKFKSLKFKPTAGTGEAVLVGK